MKDSPVCVIGQHILDGKIVELDKPLLVMRKQQPGGTSNTSYQVECVIKRKLLFHKRSKPIVQYSAKKIWSIFFCVMEFVINVTKFKYFTSTEKNCNVCVTTGEKI